MRNPAMTACDPLMTPLLNWIIKVNLRNHPSPVFPASGTRFGFEDLDFRQTWEEELWLHLLVRCWNTSHMFGILRDEKLKISPKFIWKRDHLGRRFSCMDIFLETPSFFWVESCECIELQERSREAADPLRIAESTLSHSSARLIWLWDDTCLNDF
jgi:hypothetical protein